MSAALSGFTRIYGLGAFVIDIFHVWPAVGAVWVDKWDGAGRRGDGEGRDRGVPPLSE